MSDDKAKLLRSLKIDRGTPGPALPASGRRWLLIVAGTVVCGGVAAAAFAAFQSRTPDHPREIASQPASQAAPQPRAQTSQPAAGTEAGNLSASGYVVARRKATVAAEITGKVVEVFIDEGMTVAKGDIVARLDDVLVQKDLELARS